MQLEKAAKAAKAKAHQRALALALREMAQPVGPVVPDWDAEREAVAARAQEPGVKSTYLVDEPHLWLVHPMVDRKPAGEVIVVRRKRDLDKAVDAALDEAKAIILQSGHTLAETIYAKKVIARRNGPTPDWVDKA